jgi:hypothetical protein
MVRPSGRSRLHVVPLLLHDTSNVVDGGPPMGLDEIEHVGAAVTVNIVEQLVAPPGPPATSSASVCGPGPTTEPAAIETPVHGTERVGPPSACS